MVGCKEVSENSKIAGQKQRVDWSGAKLRGSEKSKIAGQKQRENTTLINQYNDRGRAVHARKIKATTAEGGGPGNVHGGGAPSAKAHNAPQQRVGCWQGAGRVLRCWQGAGRTIDNKKRNGPVKKMPRPATDAATIAITTCASRSVKAVNQRWQCPPDSAAHLAWQTLT